MLQTYGKSDVTYDWYAGNSGVVGRSGKFIAAHAAHAGLMMFWAGAFGLFELARYDAGIPMGAQKAIVLPHLAGIGIGGIENGVITEPYGIVVICTLHLIFSAVLGAGGLFIPTNLQVILETTQKIVSHKNLISNGMIQIN